MVSPSYNSATGQPYYNRQKELPASGCPDVECCVTISKGNCPPTVTTTCSIAEQTDEYVKYCCDESSTITISYPDMCCDSNGNCLCLDHIEVNGASQTNPATIELTCPSTGSIDVVPVYGNCDDSDGCDSFIRQFSKIHIAGYTLTYNGTSDKWVYQYGDYPDTVPVCGIPCPTPVEPSDNIISCNGQGHSGSVFSFALNDCTLSAYRWEATGIITNVGGWEYVCSSQHSEAKATFVWNPTTNKFTNTTQYCTGGSCCGRVANCYSVSASGTYYWYSGCGSLMRNRAYSNVTTSCVWPYGFPGFSK